MTLTELQQYAALLDSLLDDITQAQHETLHPEISRVVASLKSHGLAIPTKLRQVNQDSYDAAFEEMLDNVPV